MKVFFYLFYVTYLFAIIAFNRGCLEKQYIVSFLVWKALNLTFNHGDPQIIMAFC